MYPRPGAQPPKKSSGGRTCLIVVLVMTGLGLLVVGIGGFLVYREFGEFFGATGDMAGIIMKALTAPGTDEVRDLGCKQALAIDMKEMAKAVQRFEDEIARRENRKPKPIDIDQADVFVQCQVGLLGSNKPTCDQVAKAYIKATSPDGKILVSVASEGGGNANAAMCTEVYDDKGTKVGTGVAPNLGQ
jgi:hypothetical protein